MLRITESKDEIIVREVPIIHWTASVTILVVLSLIGYFSFLYKRDIFDLIWTLGIFFSAGAFLFYIFAVPATTTKINKPGKTVSIRKQSLIKYSFDVYSFSEISDLIYVKETKDSRGNISYQLMLPLKDGQKIEISTSISLKEGKYFDAADLMNKYIFDTSKQIPFKLTIFNDD
ncbi:MAG TPA: hypothetical protein VGC97_09345 [Pyrinomonadaceae bacterium]|jgi:hypothetical protein